MNRQGLKNKKLPDTPGVYFFLGTPKRSEGGLGPKKEILYIGRATSLKNRVKSYFDTRVVSERGPAIEKMVEEAKHIDYEETDSVLEALILEANLIKKHQPKYNTREKSDKSFNYIVITKEDFPRVLLMRERELQRGRVDVQYAIGPFPRGGMLRDALKIIRKIFPFRDKCLPAPQSKTARQAGTPNQGRPCFSRQIGLCPGVCTGEISKTEYRKVITNLKLFFEGKKKRLLGKLQREMKQAAESQKFEKAARIKKTIFSLNHIQDVSLIKEKQGASQGKRIEGYDVAHISGSAHVGVMVAVEGGEPNTDAYRQFNIKSVEGANDPAALAEVLNRRLAHPEWPYPKLIVVDGGKAQKNRAEKVLREAGVAIPVVAVVKDEHHKPREILGKREFRQRYEREIIRANSEAHRFSLKLHRQKMRRR